MTSTGLHYFIQGLAVAFFTIMAVLNLSQRNNRLRLILGAILAIWAVQHLVSTFFTEDSISSNRYYSSIINAFDMTAEPTCAFLLLELIRPGWLTWRKVWLNEIPFIVLGAVSVIVDNYYVYLSLTGFFVIYGVAVFIITLRGIPKYDRFLREHYSYTENVNLHWLYIVLFTFLLLMTLYAVCTVFDTIWGDTIYVLGSIIGWSWISYCIYRQESVLDELHPAEVTPEEIQMPGSESIDLDEVIRTRFVKPQLYLNSSLKLSDMAKEIGTNRTYLSRYLNETLGTTFYDYVNGLRIAHAKTLIETSPDIAIMTIAQLAGFNSYSTFRRTFIVKYGLSPQDYRNQYGQSISTTATETRQKEAGDKA